jgi:hypothetical protein
MPINSIIRAICRLWGLTGHSTTIDGATSHLRRVRQQKYQVITTESVRRDLSLKDFDLNISLVLPDNTLLNVVSAISSYQRKSPKVKIADEPVGDLSDSEQEGYQFRGNFQQGRAGRDFIARGKGDL